MACPDGGSTLVLAVIPGAYYWQASYSGDSQNAPTSSWNSEIEVVTPVPSCKYGWNWGLNGGCRSQGQSGNGGGNDKYGNPAGRGNGQSGHW